MPPPTTHTNESVPIGAKIEIAVTSVLARVGRITLGFFQILGHLLPHPEKRTRDVIVTNQRG